MQVSLSAAWAPAGVKHVCAESGPAFQPEAACQDLSHTQSS